MDRRKEYRESISSGIRWVALGQAVGAGFNISVSITLARLLMPEDFGLMAMAAVITRFAGSFQLMGTSAPIIQRPNLSDNFVNSVFLLNVIVSFLLSAIVMGTAPVLAAIYDSKQVEPILRVLAISLLVVAIGGVPGALLRRRMRFDTLAKIGMSVGFLNGALQIVLAFLGFGVWTLVIGRLVGGFLETTLMFISARYRPRWAFDWEHIKDISSVMAHLTGSNVMNFLKESAAVVIIGRFFGANLLGFYATANRFSVKLLNYLQPVLVRVMFPAYSSMRHDRALLGLTMQRAAGGVSFFTFPMMAGIAAIADPFVMGVLGSKWEMIIPLLRLLAIVGALKSLVYSTNTIFLALDRADLLFRLTTVSAIVTVCALAVGAQFSLMIVVYAMIAAQGLVTIISVFLATRLIELPRRRYVGAFFPHLIASAIMAGAVYLSTGLVRSLGISDLMNVVIAIAIGGILYASFTLLYQPPVLIDLVHVLPNPVKPLASRLLRMNERQGE